MVCALVSWEIILETTVEKSPGFTTHAVLGRIVKAGVAVQSQEGFSRTKINSLGMRGEDILPKQKTDYRILILGDSFTKGIHVSDAKTYSFILQENLKTKYKSNIQVINAARDGASPAYYIYPADFYNSLIKPDSVVIQLRNGNFTDMLNNKEQFYVVQENNTFKTVYNQKFLSDDTLSKIFLQKFKQLNFMLEYSVLRVGGRNLQKILTANQTKQSATEFDLAKQLPYSHNYDALIYWTLKSLKNKYSKVVILYLPDMEYSNLSEGSSQVEIYLKKAAAQQGVDFINMRESFTLYYQLHHQPAHGFNNTVPGTGHINEIGHALTAATLTDFFEKKRAIK